MQILEEDVPGSQKYVIYSSVALNEFLQLT